MLVNHTKAVRIGLMLLVVVGLVWAKAECAAPMASISLVASKDTYWQGEEIVMIAQITNNTDREMVVLWKPAGLHNDRPGVYDLWFKGDGAQDPFVVKPRGSVKKTIRWLFDLPAVGICQVRVIYLSPAAGHYRTLSDQVMLSENIDSDPVVLMIKANQIPDIQKPPANK